MIFYSILHTYFITRLTNSYHIMQIIKAMNIRRAWTVPSPLSVCDIISDIISITLVTHITSHHIQNTFIRGDNKHITWQFHIVRKPIITILFSSTTFAWEINFPSLRFESLKALNSHWKLNLIGTVEINDGNYLNEIV